MARLGSALRALAVSAALVSGFGAGAAAQTPFRPVAVVNDSAITGFDLQQRERLLAVLGFRAASEEALRQAALQRLVDDRLKLQAGKRLGLEPTEAIGEAGFANLAEQLDTTADALRVLLRNQGVSDQAITDFVVADVIWNEVVRTRFARRIEPGEAEIDSEIALAGGGAEIAYRVQEIGIPANATASEAETRELVDRLYRELAAGGDFAAAVRRHSRAPSAASGGEVGWVSSRTMPPDIADALSRIEPGEVTPPIPVPGGFSILKVTDRRMAGAGNVDPSDPALRDRVRQRIVEQQSARLAEGLLQELRRDAIIEFR